NSSWAAWTINSRRTPASLAGINSMMTTVLLRWQWEILKEQNRARRQYVTLQGSTVCSPALLNSARFAFNRPAHFSDDVATTDLARTLTFVPGKIMGTLTVGEERGTPTIGDVGSDTNFPRFWVYNLWEFGDDLTYVK